ncbi:hypothetical protein HNO92_000533 [Chromobacterium alkanivorans]|nr:hypothetical protein [Chromobacterium alkanivorans]MCS3817209.1 hypothetical protein [Chromobacterium alkanivorans]MCS3872249.1 hypothetical protein [Chromobacterium alkanivorans]
MPYYNKALIRPADLLRRQAARSGQSSALFN